MRSKLARLTLTLTIALLVPLQGMASVAAGLCMTFGHHDMAPAAQDHGHDHGNGDPQHDAEDAPGGAHCPPCVACCASAAISSSDRVFTPESPAVSATAVLPHFVSGAPPENLDRPPLAL